MDKNLSGYSDVADAAMQNASLGAGGMCCEFVQFPDPAIFVCRFNCHLVKSGDLGSLSLRIHPCCAPH